MSLTADEKMILAIITATRADADLTTYMTGLTAVEGGAVTMASNVGPDMPDVAKRVPYLGIKFGDSEPLLSEALMSLKSTAVAFMCYARKEVTVVRMADRVTAMLKASGNADLSHFDVSDTNVTNKQTRWLTTFETERNDETDVWTRKVLTEFIWIDVPCP